MPDGGFAHASRGERAVRRELRVERCAYLVRIVGILEDDDGDVLGGGYVGGAGMAREQRAKDYLERHFVHV
jgi:hypothetical protein